MSARNIAMAFALVLSAYTAKAAQLSCGPCVTETVSSSYAPASYVVFEGSYDNLIEQTYFGSLAECETARQADERCQAPVRID